MCFWQILEKVSYILLYIFQALIVITVITWLVLVLYYYKHRAEQYWYRFKLIPRDVRDELYKINPLRTDEKGNSFQRVLFHRPAFYEAIDKKKGKPGNLTFSEPSDAPYLFECRFKAYRSVVRGTHEKADDEDKITTWWLSQSGVTELLSKLFGDIFSTVLKGNLLFCEENKDEPIRKAHFKFTGKDVPSEIKWYRSDCDICFLERIGMLVLFGKDDKGGFAFFFRCLPTTFDYFSKSECGNEYELKFNTRLFVNILIFYGWKVKFYKDYEACRKDREEQKQNK